MKLLPFLDRLLAWAAARRRARHERWKRKKRVIMPRPDPRCIVRNIREPH